MDLKTLLGEDLYQQVQAKIDAQNASVTDVNRRVKLVDLSDGGYVGREKYDHSINELNRSVNELKEQATQKESDLADLQAKLSAAQADASKLADAQTAVASLQAKYDEDRKGWEAKNAKQRYEYMVRERANQIDFSSKAAKKEFINDALKAEFKIDGDNLLGYNDFLEKYKTEDPSAFKVVEEPTNENPTIVLPKDKRPEEKSAWNFNFSGVRPKPEG